MAADSDDFINRWLYGYGNEPEASEDWKACINVSCMREPLRCCSGAMTVGEEVKTEPLRSYRKLLMYKVACIRTVWHLLSESDSRAAVDAAEAFADDKITRCAFNTLLGRAGAARQRLYDPSESLIHQSAGYQASVAVEASNTEVSHTNWPEYFCISALQLAAGPRGSLRYQDAFKPAHKLMADLMRCMVGDPFRPVEFEAHWRRADAIHLAQAIYDQRDFDHLPILADALEEAGCDNAAVLAHCREPGPHARGCWVVDQLLELDGPVRWPG